MAAASNVPGERTPGGKKDLLSILREYEKQQEKRRSINSVDEDGFILVVRESVWPSLFGEYFMKLGDSTSEEAHQGEDDMLFYVKCQPRSSEKEVFVRRINSPEIPGLGDPHVNWEETVYLNMIMHQIDYRVTCTICTRLTNRDLKVITKASLKIDASHHFRRMDSKGEESTQSYPNIFFMIDTYDEVFRSLCVREDELVCVELVARHKSSGTSAVIFLGSVNYDALKKVYDSKGSFGLKLAKRMSLGWMASDHDHVEFIRMRGPHGKGFAEMAISHFKPNNERDVRSTKDRVEHEPRKKSSIPLGTRLTYINLPWSRIMKDLLEVRQTPLFSK
eukprot:gene18132-19942_t